MVEAVVEMVCVDVVVPSGAYQEVVDGRSVGRVEEVVSVEVRMWHSVISVVTNWGSGTFVALLDHRLL
jgi:hypothetical protein